MPSLRVIRGRIRSIKSSQKITAAMKMVSAAKLRRAQEAILAARPFSNELGGLLKRLARRAALGLDGQKGGGPAHPLLEPRPLRRRALLVIMTSDRGLCGAFNANIARRAERWVRENSDKFAMLEIATIGRRGRDYFRKRKVVTARDFPGVFDALAFRRASEIAVGLSDEFLTKDLDAVFLLYNEFKSAISQRLTVVDLLPIVQLEGAEPTAEDADYLYEPSPAEVLDKLVPRYLATLLWRALLESSAAEHGARMSAMDNATRNARDLVDRLTLQYNRARQATITKELMDIVGGAEALRS